MYKNVWPELGAQSDKKKSWIPFSVYLIYGDRNASNEANVNVKRIKNQTNKKNNKQRDQQMLIAMCDIFIRLCPTLWSISDSDKWMLRQDGHVRAKGMLMW